MDDLNRIRDKIDELDQEIVRLLKNRYENAKLLGRIKQQRGLDYRDPEREKNILRKIGRAAAAWDLDPKFIRPIFDQIFSLTLQAQRDQPQKSARRLDQTKILVVGGTGGMGRVFARYASLQGAKVKLAGREINKTRTAAKEMEVEPGTILDAASSDIVILAVPMEETARVATETASLMKTGSLLTDLSSVKTGISDRIAEKIPKGLEYVSLHPLFGPNTVHLHDQTIIAVSYQSGQKWSKLSRALQASGSKIQTMSAAQHDRAMAYVQGLHHFTLIALGIGLDGMGGEPRTQSLRETEARIVSLLDSWDTIVGIQQLNPFLPGVKQKFLEVATNIAQTRSRQASGVKKRLVSNVQKWSRKL
ncbi:MAG TPA: prephenate dehydrogenase/arogenate dehydrogenase family protein [Candidatus Bathyarchaeia archaeon]|nr:prephenate dehydrogenase/arogenate dehydrogenase family protein [Candidatus Bathyarchaeia archaeon]